MRIINTIKLSAFRASDGAMHYETQCANYLKALHWDGTGLCLFAKRLERSRFVWPPLIEGGVVLTPAQFALLIEAMDWRRTVAPDPPRLPVQI
ncbi:hypothetical protein CA833_18625 [Novosphingobium sp. KA1]|nr:hypothetical protein CA833_18625 [Novosphingobium sp. KA1]